MEVHHTKKIDTIFMEKDAKEPSVPKVLSVYLQLVVCSVPALSTSSSDRDHCRLLKREKSSDSTFIQHTLSRSTMYSFSGTGQEKNGHRHSVTLQIWSY